MCGRVDVGAQEFAEDLRTSSWDSHGYRDPGRLSSVSTRSMASESLSGRARREPHGHHAWQPVGDGHLRQGRIPSCARRVVAFFGRRRGLGATVQGGGLRLGAAARFGRGRRPRAQGAAPRLAETTAVRV